MTATVLWHAFPQTQAMWRHVRDRLPERLTVITPDLPGFGPAPRQVGWTMPSAAEDAARELDALGIDRAIVGGCSMGGYVALAFARRFPERVAGLVLINSRANADDGFARNSRAENIALVEQSGTAALVEKMLPRLVGATTTRDRPEVVDAIRTLSNTQSPDAIIDALKAMRDREDLTELLPTLAVPSLILSGSEDELIPPSVSADMASRLPDCELVTVEGAGHILPWEAPDRVAAAIRARFGG